MHSDTVSRIDGNRKSPTVQTPQLIASIVFKTVITAND